MIIPPEVKKKPAEYVVLALIFILGLYFYFFMGVSPSSKRFIVASIAAAYIFWSFYHHYKRGDLTTSIVIEYLVVALFGIVLFSGTFF
jgi:hypothetical protein